MLMYCMWMSSSVFEMDRVVKEFMVVIWLEGNLGGSWRLQEVANNYFKPTGAHKDMGSSIPKSRGQITPVNKITRKHIRNALKQRAYLRQNRATTQTVGL